MNKPKLKSKTLNSILIAAVMVILGMLGVGEKEIGQTYDTITQSTGEGTEAAKDLATLAALGGAYYGRLRVGKGKDENTN
ncbi:hypothetical protein LCGC14_2243050 [marine sediment metagenome]|uniref:Uncharacterized protein n=1 Tax=marine sediment metagenome TaxID=412755 RepID=A0A0F9D504_9ZZZZ